VHEQLVLVRDSQQLAHQRGQLGPVTDVRAAAISGASMP
jgi:hypothetical protein